MSSQAGSTKRPLKVGIGLPDAIGQMHGGTARWSDLEAMAKLAEDVGFDSVWVEDHLLFRPPVTGGATEGPWECFSMLAGLAVATKRVEIGPLVACTAFRNPAITAKMADTIEEMSNGRLILGLGAGWHKPEYDAFGLPFDHLASRFEESLHIITSLLRDGRVDFEGKYYQARECELQPRGPRAGGPPILIGARKPRMLRLCAKHADMWNVYFPSDIEPLLTEVDAACDDAGRGPATLERTIAVWADFTNGKMIPSTANPGNRPGLTGTPEEMAQRLRDYVALGISHIQIWLEPNNLAGIEACAPVLELLDRG